MRQLRRRCRRAVRRGKGNTSNAKPVRELAALASGFDRSRQRAQAILYFLLTCDRFLAAPTPLPVEQILAIAGLMATADGDEDVGIEEEMMRAARVAGAVVLLLGAGQWLAINQSVRDRARSIVNSTIGGGRSLKAALAQIGFVGLLLARFTTKARLKEIIAKHDMILPGWSSSRGSVSRLKAS